MRSRRGEVPFVAIRVGRSNDPREVLGVSRELKCSRAEALGFVALWEELILEVGDAISGRVKGYAAVHIATKLGFEGSPAKIVNALKAAGLLATQRGVFLHPYWAQSVTGQYARDRAELRERWRLKKAEQRAEDVPAVSRGQAGDNGGTSMGTADIDRLINGNGGAAPPPAPRLSPGGAGSARWEWMLKNHDRPRNSRACIRYLDAMTEEDWALCQWVVTRPPAGSAPLSLSRKRVRRLDSHRFLASEAFLELRGEWVEKLAQEKRPPRPAGRPKSSPAEDLASDNARRLMQATAYILAKLKDDEIPAAEKEAAKVKWMSLHPEVSPPPWEATPALQQ